ncbi:MAG: hypothetical protein LBS79_00645 [Tannerella sp.]|jgi:hypothetical protein|nr:hypothetical protein [Tannerella sp.]
MQQQNQHPKIRNRPLSPIEQLLADKTNIKAMCREQEQKLGEDFAYLRENVSGLLLSGISSLLFSSGKAGKKTDERNESNVPFAASGYLAITKSLLPVIWSIVQPMLITWGINKAKSFIFGLFSGKKKISSRN